MSLSQLALEEIRERAIVLLGDEAYRLRSRYIDAFVDTAHPYYREHIEQPKDPRYSGYLWDLLIDAELISEDEICGLIPEAVRVYAMWDLHSPEKISIPDYWKFPVEGVLWLLYGTLLRGLQHLPEDLYIFDDGLRWTIALTHEYLDKDTRFIKAIVEGLAVFETAG